jgi:uncharacterized protein (DUF983 family)
MTESLPGLKVLVARGLRRRCPRCGKGAVFRRWFKVREQCDFCGLKYLENQGDLWGVLLFTDRVLFIVPLITLFFIGRGAGSIWPYLFGIFLVIALVLTFPHRIGVTIALDYRIRLSSTDLSSDESARREMVPTGQDCE